jgi:hypothetical protein
MQKQISRRGFVKTSVIASAAVPLGLSSATRSGAQTPATPAVSTATPPQEALPKGKMGGQEFSRLIMGGNLFGGWSHSRELTYVSTLMRRYNTDAKIRETLELAEAQGVTGINTYVMQDNKQLFDHWKCGGKMKWFVQVRLDSNGGYSQIQKAVDEGAAGIHVNGDAAESILNEGKFEKIGEMVEMIRSKKRVAGVGAHDLRVIVECEKAKLDVDFYQKTLHSHEYFTAPHPGEKDAIGPHDNSWCSDPQAVIDFMATVKKPWIAFKILAAGAIAPRAGFTHAVNSGADFILVGMFDWQVEEDTKLARRVFTAATSSDSKRTRPWYG